MLKQRTWPWPPELGPNTPTERARTVARGYRGLSSRWVRTLESARAADVAELVGQLRTELAALDAMAAQFGEHVWLMPTAATKGPGETLTRAEVAARAGVSPAAVTQWGSDGLAIGPAGARVHLRPHGGRYDPDEVDEFLHLRDTATRVPAQRGRPETSRPNTPGRASSNPRS